MKRYYWLKLQDNFFREKTMKKLRKVAGGATYIIIYLKMQLLSLRNEGKLFFDGVEDSFFQELSLEIDEDPADVEFMIYFLIKHGLLMQLESDEYMLPEAYENTRSEAESTQRVRACRARKRKSATLELPGGADEQKTLHCNANGTATKQLETIGNTGNTEQRAETEADTEQRESRAEKLSTALRALGVDQSAITEFQRNYSDEAITIQLNNLLIDMQNTKIANPGGRLRVALREAWPPRRPVAVARVITTKNATVNELMAAAAERLGGEEIG